MLDIDGDDARAVKLVGDGRTAGSFEPALHDFAADIAAGITEERHYSSTLLEMRIASATEVRPARTMAVAASRKVLPLSCWRAISANLFALCSWVARTSSGDISSSS